MLILTRTPQESLIIQLPDHREIKVMLVSVHGQQARIGIEADRDIIITREELLYPEGSGR